MTKQEASRRYNIPTTILEEYEKWGLCHEVKKVMGSWQYDDSDLERLSTVSYTHLDVYKRQLLGHFLNFVVI